MNWYFALPIGIGCLCLIYFVSLYLSRLSRELWRAAKDRIRRGRGLPAHISKVCKPGEQFEMVAATDDGLDNLLIIRSHDGRVRCVTYGGVFDSREREERFLPFAEGFWAKPGRYEFSAIRETDLATGATATVLKIRPVVYSTSADGNLHGTRAHRVVIAANN